MRRLTVLAAAFLVLASCIPPEPDDDLIVKYDPEETVMGEIQQRGELVVAVPPSAPFDGFTAHLGTLIGDALGVDTRTVPMEPPDILSAPEEGEADISFPLIAVTEKLVRHYAMVDPFYVAHQRLLVPQDSAVEQVDDLEGVVCQYIDEETGVNIGTLNAAVHPISPPDPDTCLKGIRTGDVQAITAADWLAFPLLAKDQDLKIAGDELTTEAYAPLIESGASAWTDFVEGVLAEADAEGDWEHSYAKWFGPLDGPETGYPDMTIEEAAALFPKDV